MSTPPTPSAPLEDSGGRLKGVSIMKPIIIGNVASYFGKKREEDGHTHSWTVYLRPYPQEDYSSFIKKVQFKLHDSYANSTRVVNSPPYEVTESGWGEFEITIKIYFNDPLERPVTLYHALKLFQPGGVPGASPVKKDLVFETYDEIIFQEPTALLKSLLDATPVLESVPWTHAIDVEEGKEATAVVLTNSKQKVKEEITDLRTKLNLARDTIENFKNILVSEGIQLP